MFDIGALEFVVLAIAALFIFGPDRLPDMARQAARGLRQLRTMAANARRELSRELGPEFEDLDIRDLNPRTFVRKHVLDGLDDDLRFDKDLDLRDDLRVDLDSPKRTSTVNGTSRVSTPAAGASTGTSVATSSSGATATGTTTTETLADGATSATAGSGGDQAAADAHTSARPDEGASAKPAPVPPFDPDAT